MWRRYRRTHANIDEAQPTTRTHPPGAQHGARRVHVPVRQAQKCRMQRTSKSGATGGREAAAGRAAYTLTSSAMTGSSRRWGRGARSQRSSFTEELVHGLVDLSLTPLLCRRNSCAVPSAAARPRLDDMATLSTSAGAVSGGAHRGVRETMAFSSQDGSDRKKCVYRVDADE